MWRKLLSGHANSHWEVNWDDIARAYLLGEMRQEKRVRNVIYLEIWLKELVHDSRSLIKIVEKCLSCFIFLIFWNQFYRSIMWLFIIDITSKAWCVIWFSQFHKIFERYNDRRIDRAMDSIFARRKLYNFEFPINTWTVQEKKNWKRNCRVAHALFYSHRYGNHWLVVYVLWTNTSFVFSALN